MEPAISSTIDRHQPMPEPSSARTSRWSIAAPVACGCLIAAAAAFVATSDPSGAGFHLPACPLYAATGLWCPGCGTTRAAHSLVRGDIAAAFGFNLFFPVFVGAIVVGWLAWMRRSLGRAPVVAFSRMPRWPSIALAATLIVFGIVRNLPGFQALRP